MKRLGIYFFYDKDGIVDRYVPYFLSRLKPFCEELCIVVNGKLTPDGRNILEKCGNKLIVRENSGFDSGAYKEAIESYGYEKIKEYDELLLCNFTFFGPVYPLDEMFSEMSKRQCDMWGITRHPKAGYKLAGQDVLPHIQSYFLVFRKNILISYEFKKFWETLKRANNYDEAIAYFELRCSPYFEEKGFRTDTYIDYEKYEDRVYNSTIQTSINLLREDRCPFIKRRALNLRYNAFLYFCNGQQPAETLKFLKEHTDYDISLIWENLLRTDSNSALRQTTHQTYILPAELSAARRSTAKIALIAYIYYPELIDYCFDYIKNMPEEADIFIITVGAAKKAFDNKLSLLPFKHVELRVQENRGRDVAALLVTAADIIKKYDYICFVHDKKTPYYDKSIIGEDFCRNCFEGVLKSRDYIRNIIKTLDDNPHIGLLTPPPALHSHFFQITGREWGTNYANAVNLLKKLGLDIDPDPAPTAPFGTIFWFRTKAFVTLMSYPWSMDDFPQEPIGKADGTILHALERLYPVLAQHDGFLSAWSMPDDFAAVYLDNLYYMLREFNMELFNHFGYMPHYDLVNCLHEELNDERRIKHPIWFYCTQKLRYFRYKILAKILFGKKRKKYKKKKAVLKEQLKSFHYVMRQR